MNISLHQTNIPLGYYKIMAGLKQKHSLKKGAQGLHQETLFGIKDKKPNTKEESEKS